MQIFTILTVKLNSKGEKSSQVSFIDEILGTKSGVAYLGVSQNYVYHKPKSAAPSAQLTVSLYPRDAIAVQHGGLKLLVNDADVGSTKVRGSSYRALPGWFGGEVAKVPLSDHTSRDSVFISVLKRSSPAPVPFVLTVKLDDGFVLLTPHAPVWAVVQRRKTDYYTFEVTDPRTDIGIYVTPISGDPGLLCDPVPKKIPKKKKNGNDQDGAPAGAAPANKPVPGHALWEEHHPGGESMFIVANDPKRLQANAKTGNFTVGVYGTQTSVYSIMVILDPHLDPESAEGKRDESLIGPSPLWGEAYLGMQQRMSLKKGRTGHVLFFNMLEREFVDVGLRIDAATSSSSSSSSSDTDNKK
eukprot:g12182.t1